MTLGGQITPGSWWRNPRTAQRLCVPRHPSVYMVEEARWGSNPGRYRKRHGPGQPYGRVPAFQEGAQLSLAWLLPEEIMGAWRRYRPSGRDAVPVPPWVTKPPDGFNDFMLDDQFWVGVLAVRGHLVALIGLDPPDQPFTHWGTAAYTTVFIETDEVRARLRPKFSKLPVTAWDHVTRDAD